MKSSRPGLHSAITLLSLLAAMSSDAAHSTQAALDPTPPSELVKLVFIHHSTGENWLADNNGRLGIELGENNYFVSDTNYGWGPDGIGDRTDIPDWLEWFRSKRTASYTSALFRENNRHSPYSRKLTDPGGKNEIILFKSCFPNSNLSGRPTDPPRAGTNLTVGNAKFVYNELLRYFAIRQDKLFVVITAPPVTDPTYAENARAFNDWLVKDWLRENGYPYQNVVVFDFYNVLTGPDNHHRYIDGAIEHTYVSGMNTSYYPSGPGDDHPSKAGNVKARNQLIPLLNSYYHRWKAGPPDLRQMRVQIRSTRTEDGWILESSENSNLGAKLGSNELRAGDDKRDRQYRSILSFDTSVLPANAWISSATLRIKRSSSVGSNPFRTHGNLLVDIRTSHFGTNTRLQAADFRARASRNKVGRVRSKPTNQWYRAALNDTAFQWVKTNDKTQFRLQFKLDDDDDHSADYMTFHSGRGATANRPTLILKYLIP